MPHDCWLAPDRDSPTLTFDIDIGKALSALLRMDGEDGHSEDRLRAITGQTISRPRRWHKMFERMGLMYRDAHDRTHITDLGRVVRGAETTARSELVARRIELARSAVRVLRLYQLRNPADEKASDYPMDCDLHPYWAVWRAAVLLDYRLHWDEFVRVIMHVLRHADLDAEIERIREARLEPGYNPENNGSSAKPLGDRCGDADTGNARDHTATPWLRRAGLGGVLLQEAGLDGKGYWTVPGEVRDLVKAAIDDVPAFQEFLTVADWFDHYGRLQTVAATRLTSLDPATLVARIRVLAPDMELDPKLIARVVTAMTHDSRRHFIIVKGISGTGKTRLVKLLAQAAYDGDVDEPYFLHVAVRPDWTDSTPLLGVFNPIENRYERPRFLEALRQAAREPDRPFFVCLDEMNIARVEYYLAEILSGMETGTIHLETHGAEAIEPSLPWPAKLYLFGTVNVDESTLAISDKVLDRANVVDTSDIQITPFIERRVAETALATLQREDLARVLNDVWQALRTADGHFGFRTAEGIIRYVDAAVASSAGILDFTEALDDQVAQRVLPKLRGTDSRWTAALEQLEGLLAGYPKSSGIVTRMRADLRDYGSFQYWK